MVVRAHVGGGPLFQQYFRMENTKALKVVLIESVTVHSLGKNDFLQRPKNLLVLK